MWTVEPMPRPDAGCAETINSNTVWTYNDSQFPELPQLLIHREISALTLTHTSLTAATRGYLVTYHWFPTGFDARYCLLRDRDGRRHASQLFNN